MKHRGLKFLFLLLSLALLVGLLSGMSAYAEEYPIWIGKTQVKSENASDILGNGTAKYDANTKTLTLDNFNFTANNKNEVHNFDYTGCIFIGDSSDSITIELKGANTLTNNIFYGSGIYSGSALAFSGSGSLNASGAFSGIYSSSNITVNSGNITAAGFVSASLKSQNGVIEIRGGTVTACGDTTGIESSIKTGNGIIITDGTVTADGGTSAPGLYAENSSVKIDGGTVTASGTAGIASSGGEVQINGGIIIASGSLKAIYGNLKNTIAGTGWTDKAGTQGKTEIPVSAEPQDLSQFKKVEFKGSAPSTDVTVTYVANGGSGSMKPWKGAAGTKIKIDACGFLPPAGMTFINWYCTERDTSYNPMQEITVDKNLTLTAQWKKSGTDGGSHHGGGSGGGVDLVFNIPGADNTWEYAPGYAPQQAYRVSLAPMQGGSAALGLTTGESTETAMNVYPTTTVYVFPNAEQGYVLDKIVWSLIDGSASYDITEAKTFVMPAMDVVVYVTFKPAG